MNSGSEVGDHPAAKSPNAVRTLIVQGSDHGSPPVWEIGVNLLRFFEECKTMMSFLFIYLNIQSFAGQDGGQKAMARHATRTRKGQVRLI
jgi:hypothetical protein